MSLSAVSDLGWRLQRDMPDMSGMAGNGVPVTLTCGRAAASATQNSNSTDANGTATSSGGNSALAQNVQLFLQALYESLSTSVTTPAIDSATASTAHQHSIYNPPASLTYSRGSVANYRTTAYQQGPKSLQSKLQSMINALSDPDEEVAADNVVSGLQGAFKRLMRDLDLSGSGSGSGLSLRSWLLGLQQNLQQPGASSFSAVGNMIDVTA
jgi:hypothetical protein